METITTNKKFINASIVLVVLLSLFVLALFVNQVKLSSYVGRETQAPATIAVSGTGDVMAVSDIATLYVNITKEASTTKEAKKLLDESVAKTMDYLKTQKIEDKDIKAEYNGLNPKYGQEKTAICYTYPCPPQAEAKIIGYTANQAITIKVRAIDTANEISTGLANLGITNISGPTLSIDDESGFKDQARSKAIEDARAKAKVLAKELGVRLGKVVTFSENGYGGGYPMMYEAKVMNQSADGMRAPAPELPKGENKITSNVMITYEIR